MRNEVKNTESIPDKDFNKEKRLIDFVKWHLLDSHSPLEGAT